MTIGQTLRSYRMNAGLNQAEMAANVVSESFYSRVERDLNRIDAETLIKILQAHHFNVANFFNRMSESETPRPKSLFGIQGKIVAAVNNDDLNTLKKVEKEIKQDPDCPQWLVFRFQMAYAWLTHSNEKISPKLKARVKAMINKENWDYLSFHFLSQALIFLDLKDVVNYTKKAFKAYQKNTEPDITTLENIAVLAINFLIICAYHNVDFKTAKIGIDFLKSLPVTPEIGLAKILGTYYEAFFKHDEATTKAIIKILKQSGQYSLIKDSVEHNKN